MLTSHEIAELTRRVPDLAQGINVVLLENVRQVAHTIQPLLAMERRKKDWEEVKWTDFCIALGYTMAQIEMEKRGEILRSNPLSRGAA